jgi:hypothetical protein
VDFLKAKRVLGFTPTWGIWDGIEEMKFKFDYLLMKDFSGYVRLARLKSLMESGKIDKDLRWTMKG